MRRSLQGLVIGALVLAGAAVASTDGQAMFVEPLGSTASHTINIEHAYWRGGYGYGFHRYGYGWRRPFYGYGYRRW